MLISISLISLLKIISDIYIYIFFPRDFTVQLCSQYTYSEKKYIDLRCYILKW